MKNWPDKFLFESWGYVASNVIFRDERLTQIEGARRDNST